MINKIKILICSPKKNTGGISMWTRHILDYFKANGDCNLYIDWYYKDSSEDTLPNLNIIQRVLSGIKQYIPLVKGVKQKLKSEHYDIFHASSSASLGLIRDLWLLKICKRLNVKSVIHLHFGRIPSIFTSRGWEYKLLHRVISRATKIIVMDKASYNVLINNGYNNIELVPNPLSPTILSIINSNGNVIREDNKIVFVGHVVATKGIMELVEACKQLSKTITGLSLHILGHVKEDMATAILTAAGESSERWLHLLGNQPMEVVIREMLTSNVFALPTYTEGFPNVILESMACGCSIVTTPVGAIPEMLDINSTSPCGVCVDVKSINQLKCAIEKMLSNKEEALILGDVARQRVIKEYSIDVIGTQLENIWKTI